MYNCHQNNVLFKLYNIKNNKIDRKNKSTIIFYKYLKYLTF